MTTTTKSATNPPPQEIDYVGRGLYGYGGENMELGLKSWMCGGEVWAVPCSRILHYSAKRQPMSHPGRPVNKVPNSNQLFLVDSFYDDPLLMQYVQTKFGKLTYDTERRKDLEFNRKLSERLKCGGIRRLFENLMPRMELHSDNEIIGYKLKTGDECVYARNDVTLDKLVLKLEPCTYYYDDELWNIVRMSRGLGHIRIFNRNCLDVGLGDDPLVFGKCHFVPRGGNQNFLYKKNEQQIIFPVTGKCLDRTESNNLRFSPCSKVGIPKWEWVYEKYSDNPNIAKMMANKLETLQNNVNLM